MLLEAAIGDAFGAGYEYTGRVPRAKIKLVYVQHPTHRSTLPGMYTDDTQMSLALAELLVEGRAWNAYNLAAKFVEVFHRDPRQGYAGSFYSFLRQTTNADDFLANIRPHSDKSGAAMRAWPLGVLPEIGNVLDYAEVQAKLTHNTPDGIHAAQAAALMTHYFLQRLGPKCDLGAFIASVVPGSWQQPWEGKVGSKGWMSVRAAITAVQRNDQLGNLLIDCVAFSGDVDTVATIASAAAACSEEYIQVIPNDLLTGLENGPYGRTYLQQLDQRLFALT